MGTGMKVCLIEKLSTGGLFTIDERVWSTEMIEALHHVNYLTHGGIEYETIEGRLNIDTGVMELLLTKVNHF
ncbi:hypothetical protein [Paenibacillus sp. NEAU-GSW1]|uniref:hypothetical protein n=1 Tax=Paenibacillus sp. NEAU-GSW1 TaxID=2682486 RepID=UPI0012E25088|nr:hypothetical protein [Paenibacillus sp. NEAU-GSW1]MUT68706.1 hypothetical protein [Paenibacillus sp. NEAU-GSW1]